MRDLSGTLTSPVQGTTGTTERRERARGKTRAAEEHGGQRARYTQQETDECRVDFVPESGEGKTVWYLPEGAELVD